MIPLPWLKYGVFALIGISLIGFASYKLVNYGYNKAVSQYTAKELKAEKDARATEAKLRKQLDKALHESAIRELQIKDLSNELDDASKRLFDAIAGVRGELPSASRDAAANTADSALSLFGECQKEYGELAEKADRHANDVETLTKAWPKD